MLLAWGTKDRILPVKGYAPRMRRLLPGSSWRSLPGLGHIPMGDDPELVAATIADFAARAPFSGVEAAAAVAQPTG